MVSALISMAFNVSLVLILGEKLSVGGIALLSGLSAGVNMAVNLAFAVKQKLVIPEKSDIIDIAKSLISAFVMGAAVYSSSLFINGGKILSFALPTMIGVVVYAVMTVLVKSEEMQGILSVLKKKRGAE
jgi:peptidoglycan biosynthesis protein MviN/MurJ (putative lipid II flippase)